MDESNIEKNSKNLMSQVKKLFKTQNFIKGHQSLRQDADIQPLRQDDIIEEDYMEEIEINPTSINSLCSTGADLYSNISSDVYACSGYYDYRVNGPITFPLSYTNNISNLNAWAHATYDTYIGDSYVQPPTPQKVNYMANAGKKKHPLTNIFADKPND